MAKGTTKLANVIQIDEKQVKDHLGEIVRGTVEETLNNLLDAEADRLCNAQRCERSPDRRDTRAGSYECPVTLREPVQQESQRAAG